MMNIDKIDFLTFTWIWQKSQNMNTPSHQIKMCNWLDNIWNNEDKKQALLMAFRNSGKSTIVGLFCAWVLYNNPSVRILVIAADYSLAKKMVRNVKRIIERHVLTKKLKPKKLEQWASDQFTINRDTEFRDPSMLSKGLGANITGLRADIIICDDVEVPKNCDSATKRKELREKLDELDYILTPNGMQLYVGTPHNFYTIYQTKEEKNKIDMEPFLLDFDCLKIPILDENNQSAWPTRFSNEKIAGIRARSGENKFLSQMMLEAVDISDSVLTPERLVSYYDEAKIIEANGFNLMKIGDVKIVSASCWWDPAFANANNSKGDNSVIAVVFCDEEGKYWLHDIKYIKVPFNDIDNAASYQCSEVVDFIEKYNLPSIHVEINGIGKFLPGILRNELKKRNIRTSVIEEFTTKNKDSKIMEAFDVILAEKALKAHKRIWQTPFIVEMREWRMDGNSKDDALDAVAGCLISEPIRLPKISYGKNPYRANWQGSSRQFDANIKFDI